MGIFDVFSGSAGRNAAIWAGQQATNAYNQTQGLVGDYLTNALGEVSGSTQLALGELGYGRDTAAALLPQYFNNATGAITGGYDAARGVIGPAFNNAIAAIQGGLTPALGSLTQGMQTGQGQIQAGAAQGRGDINAGLERSLGMLREGYGAGTQAINDASQYYRPYMATGADANTMLSGALGLSGQAGRDAATAAFRAAPGYDYQQEQGRQQILRSAAQTGGMTGNTLAAIQARGQAQADQGWDSWLTRLTGQQGMGLTATGQYNTAQGNLAAMLAQGGAAQAGLTSQAANNLSNIATQTGNLLGTTSIAAGQTAGQWQNTASQQVADMLRQQGMAQSNLYTSEANNLSNLSQGLGTALGNAYLNTGTQMASTYANAGQQYANIYGTGMTADVNALQHYTDTLIGAGTKGMMAGQEASATGLNALLGGIGTLGSFLAPRGAGGTSILGSLGGMLGLG